MDDYRHYEICYFKTYIISRVVLSDLENPNSLLFFINTMGYIFFKTAVFFLSSLIGTWKIYESVDNFNLIL